MGWFSRKPASEPAPEPVLEPDTEAVWFEDWPTTASDGDATITFPEPPSSPEGEYEGRLVCDGLGNLLADEGDWQGYGVYHNLETGVYEYVPAGGGSHNQIHHQRVASVKGTTDKDAHDERPTEDDAHYDADGGSWHPKRGWSHTLPVIDPDEIAATVTAHTAAYTQEKTL